MDRILLVTFFLAIINSSFAQMAFLEIEEVAKCEDLHFPIINADDSLISEKINIHLQLSELEIIKGKEIKHIFERVTTNDGTIYGGKVSISFEILQNTNRNLSIKFDEASCGATCAYWVNYYNFNPLNGDRYSLQDFFSKSNFEQFKKLITPIRQHELKSQIEELNDKAQGIKHMEEYIYDFIANDDLDNFYFDSDNVFFDHWNLFGKHDKFFDLNNVTKVSISQFAHLLNDFGKAALLNGKGLKSYISSSGTQLYEGTLGDRTYFYLLFRNTYKNRFEGTYAYKRIGKGIYLSGRLEDQVYFFEEFDENYDESAIMSFKLEKEQLVGYWAQKENEKWKLIAHRK